MNFKLISIGLLLTGVLSYIAPALFISNGAEQFKDDEKEHVEEALAYLKNIELSSPSFYKLYTTKFKAIRLQKIEFKNPNPKKEVCNYEVVIQSYTYFGIKHGEFVTYPCGG